MRYKGLKIPTYEEVLENMELENFEEDPQFADKLVADARGVNVIICTKEEAEKIKEMDGINGINNKIKEVLEDYVDHYMDQVLGLVDGVKDMEDAVNADPHKKFKNKFAEDKPVITVSDDEIKESTAIEETEIVKLTDEQVEAINQEAEKVVDNNKNLKMIRDLPSNNGVLERDPEDIEEGEAKLMNVSVDPNTGEHRILGNTDQDFEDSINETFEEMCERISNNDIDMQGKQDKEIDEEEASELLKMDKKNLLSLVSEEEGLDNISLEAMQTMIKLANKKIAKEDFSVYNALPDEIKELIDQYAEGSGIPKIDKRYREMKHSVAEMLLDDFVQNINMERMKHDFNSELETMFNKASENIGEEIVGYSEQKIQKYKEVAKKMDDPEKKQKLLDVLDRIQEAYDLNELKEFAKKCKIKKFDLEKPGKYFDRYRRKYDNSNYNIYSIEMARPILYRNLNNLESVQENTIKYTDKDINAFFIAFCKQTTNMQAENTLDHAYMYYVIYNIVLADLNKSEKTKHVSDTFLYNVMDVIDNLKSRNGSVLYP